jgi:enoyl-CoA hydratase/carnithine racemase
MISQNSPLPRATAARFPIVLATAQKPVIAAVNGLAVGVGVTLLAQCDLVYAAETANFRTPFIDLALVPEGASSILMPAARSSPSWPEDGQPLPASRQALPFF